MVQKEGNANIYWTAIDYGNGLIAIKPTGEDSKKNNKEPVYNKTYQVVVKTFQIK